MVFPFGALAPDGRARGRQWHSRGQRFDPAYLHQKAPKSLDFGAFSYAAITEISSPALNCSKSIRTNYINGYSL